MPRTKAGRALRVPSAQSSGDLPPAYNPAAHEDATYQLWEQAGYLHAAVDPSKKPYSIAMPPPNATGELHVGHALGETIDDILARYHRMLGDNVLLLPGTDHAAISSQTLVEKLIAEREGKTRHDLGREEFLKRVRQFVEESKGNIRTATRRLGVSCDWSRERYTMDAQMTRAVNAAFVKLYNDKLIYRGKRIVSWCPRCASGLSDIEVEYEEAAGNLWFIKYPVVDEGGKWSLDNHILVATTRPETMLGDTAVAVNPTDKRYKKLVGKHVLLPLMEREIPILADKHVDAKFGTGALKVTPAHDMADYDIATRHNLEAINVIGESGRMTRHAKEFADMELEDAREAVVKRLQELGFLERVEEFSHKVPVCERCATRVQPLVSDQWFVKIEPLAKKAREAVKSGKIKFVSERFEKAYFQWMDNIHDWNISRQIWWGHRIPVYTCDACHEVIVAAEKPSTCPACHASKLTQDPDTLDTWFSSGLWTFATLGWPDKTPELEHWHPTDLMECGRDILFFWVARMSMLTLYLHGEVPFKEVYLHGLVLDEHGKKMSKSKGNGIDLLEVGHKYGMDAVRVSLVTGVSGGLDSRLNEKKIETFRNTVNKLWNVGRFILTTTKCERTCSRLAEIKLDALELEDQWILHRLDELTESVTMAIESYRFSDASQAIIDFLWNDLADWYLEVAKLKPSATKNDVLLAVLEQLLVLFHPFAPFVTEVLWQELKKADSETARRPDLIVAPWPSSLKTMRNASSAKKFDELRELISGLRAIRTDYRIDTKAIIDVSLKSDDLVRANTLLIEKLAKVQLATNKGSDTSDKSGKGVARTVAGRRVVAQLADVVDIEREHARVSKELRKLETVLASLSKRLKSKAFTGKAPAAVVAKERERESELTKRVSDLKQLVTELGQLG